MEMITLKTKKPTLAESLRMGSGVLLLVTGILAMLSIVGFLPGIGLFLVGYLLMHFGRPKVGNNLRKLRRHDNRASRREESEM